MPSRARTVVPPTDGSVPALLPIAPAPDIAMRLPMVTQRSAAVQATAALDTCAAARSTEVLADANIKID